MATPSRLAALAISLAIILAALAQTSGAAAIQTTQTPALKIVVLKGEDAVNIIQQKTAVAPLVEVRDRNNLPVSGAVVTFTVGGGQGATFGGATTLTVTTNAAGQAAAAGFTPTAAGAIQVNATAVFQGQTAIATITQTNVMTAAEAAGAAGGSAGGGGGTAGAAGGAGGAGGGLGAGAIAGIVGGVAAGAAGVAAAAGGGDSGGSTTTGTAPTNPTSGTPPPTTTTTAPTTSTTTTTTVAPASGTFSGPADGPYVVTYSASGFNCTFNYAFSGTTMKMTLTTGAGGSVSGNVDYSGTLSNLSNTCNQPGLAPPPLGALQTGPFTQTAQVTGTTSSFRFTQDLDQSQQGLTVKNSISITGSLANGVVTGTYQVNLTISGSGIDMRGTVNIPFTLR